MENTECVAKMKLIDKTLLTITIFIILITLIVQLSNAQELIVTDKLPSIDLQQTSIANYVQLKYGLAFKTVVQTPQTLTTIQRSTNALDFTITSAHKAIKLQRLDGSWCTLITTNERYAEIIRGEYD